jgi:hypothetical protein
MKTWIRTCALVTMSLALCCAAQATIIFDTLAGTGSDPGAAEIFKDSWVGQSFTTDGSSTLQSITLGMQDQYPGGTLDNKFFVRLYAADGVNSTPGTLLLTLAGNASPAAVGDYTFTGTQTLSANTTYWVVAGDTGVNTYPYHWGFDYYDLGVPGPASIGTTTFSPDGSGQLPYWHAPYASEKYFAMQVDVAPVPEPSTCIAGALLLLPFGASLIRKLRKA